MSPERVRRVVEAVVGGLAPVPLRSSAAVCRRRVRSRLRPCRHPSPTSLSLSTRRARRRPRLAPVVGQAAPREAESWVVPALVVGERLEGGGA